MAMTSMRFRITRMQHCPEEKELFRTYHRVLTILTETASQKVCERQIKELELEARGKRQRRSPEGSSHDCNLVISHPKRLSHQTHSRLLRDRSNESRDVDSVSSRRERGRHPNATKNTISQALRRIAQSPFGANRACRDAETLHSTVVHLLQWQDRSSGACKSFHPTYGSLLQEQWSFIQGVSIQSQPHDNGVIQHPEEGIHPQFF